MKTKGRTIGITTVAVVFALFAVIQSSAQEFESRAKRGFMMDAHTGTVLYSKDPDAPFPPASLAKLMTMEVVFNAIRKGELSLTDTFPVSENAWRTGGAPSRTSTMFAELGSSVPLEDLIRGVIVQSANDGCIIIAEAMDGSEEKFARRMTERARELGLTKSVFKNSTGLPADGQIVTARELVQLSQHIWRTYPEFYKYYSELEFTWNKIRQFNRNPLLKMGIGADGLKTGFTEESGFAITGSAERDGLRLFVALGGMKSRKERAQEARRALDWGMKAFERIPLYEADEIVGEAKVFGGDKSRVVLKAKNPISILVPIASRDRLKARIVYQGPVMAPVEAGTPVGHLRVWIGDKMSQETELFAAEDISVGSLHSRAFDAIEELLTGWLRQL